MMVAILESRGGSVRLTTGAEEQKHELLGLAEAFCNGNSVVNELQHK